MSAPSRRAVLACTAALAAAGPASAATTPDTALITACAEFHRLQAIVSARDDDVLGEAEAEHRLALSLAADIAAVRT